MPLPECSCVNGLPTQQQLGYIYCALLEALNGGIGLSAAQISEGGGELTSTLLFVGNSIGVDNGALISYASRISVHPAFLQSTIVNNCVIAQSLATLNSSFATLVAPYAESVTGRPLVVVLFCPGGVDLVNGDSAVVVEGRIQTFVAAVHALSPPGEVMLSTVTPGTAFAGAPDVQRLAENVWITANPGEYDYFVPLALMAPDSTDTKVYSDGQHFTNTGMEIAANATLTVLLGGTYRTIAPAPLFSQVTLGDISAGFKFGGIHGTAFAFGELSGTLFLKMPATTGLEIWNSSTVQTFVFKNDGSFKMSIATGLFQVPTTNTAAGTTGARTIDKISGSVNLAAAATSLVVTNSTCFAASHVFLNISTNDASAFSVRAVPVNGSFTIRVVGVAPVAETRVDFFIVNA